jgi:hypothetical protein
MRKKVGPLTISGGLYFKLRLDHDTHLWIKHKALPYHACEWGQCYKPATRWVKQKNQYYWGGKFCGEHAMWTCKELHGFDGRTVGDPEWWDEGKNFSKWIKKHKNHERCVPTPEQKLNMKQHRKQSMNEYLERTH